METKSVAHKYPRAKFFGEWASMLYRLNAGRILPTALNAHEMDVMKDLLSEGFAFYSNMTKSYALCDEGFRFAENQSII